jgi:hypothetical protein
MMPSPTARLQLTLTFVLLSVCSCSSKPNEPSAVFFVLLDPAGFSVRLDGQPLESLEMYIPGLDRFQPSYRLYSKEDTHRVVVLHQSEVIIDKTVSRGTYVINATANKWVSAQEVAYGRELGPDAIWIPPQGLGIYLISWDTNYAAFGFDSEAPKSMVSHRGLLKNARFVQLRSGPR